MAKKNNASNNDMTMKIVIAVALLLAFVGGYFVARAKYKPQIKDLTRMVTEKDEAMQKLKSNANRIMMKEDQMWIVENGEARVMDADMMLSDGTKVMSDGKVINPDGQEWLMQNGEAVDMDGKKQGNDESTSTDVQY